MRESPALDIIHLLTKRGAQVTYSDPFVPKLRPDGVLAHDLAETHDNAKFVRSYLEGEGVERNEGHQNGQHERAGR